MITFDHVRSAIQMADFDPQKALMEMAPGRANLSRFQSQENPPRQAGVLILVYPESNDLAIVLTKRNDLLNGHSGQISFPGGKRDPEDRSFTDTALRETCEELGICDDEIEILGLSSQIYIPPSNFQVYPSVGIITHKPHFIPNPDEVTEVFGISLTDLVSGKVRHIETRNFDGLELQVPYYLVQGHKVWGATAIMLSEIESRLRYVLPEDVLIDLAKQ